MTRAAPNQLTDYIYISGYGDSGLYTDQIQKPAMPLNKKEQLIGAVCSFFAILLHLLYLILGILGMEDSAVSLIALRVAARVPHA